ncbi:MAG: hypothetical protein R3F61_11415 [Myxococcota bacterium]
MTLALLLSLLVPTASTAEVEMSGTWLRMLMAPDADKPEKGPRPWVATRDVVLTEAEDAVRIRAVWSLEAVEPGWIDVPVVDASVRLDRATLGGSGVALKALNDGRRHLVAWIDGPTTLVVEGEVVAELRRGVTLALLPAPVGQVRVETADPVVDVTSGSVAAIELDGRFWTGADTIRVSSTAEKPAAKSDQLAVGAVGMGVTVSDGAMGVRARVRWRVVRGELDRVSFEAPGAGTDLAVTGAIVAGWDRVGDTVTVDLRERQKASVEIEASWSVALPDRDEARVPFPMVEPRGVFRTERSVQLARDGDREIVPDFGTWEPLPAAALPDIARDLVVGTPASAWRITDTSRPQLGLLRFSPVSGPPTIVDVAAYDGALSQDGRLLMRAHYTVRNDRGAFLRVTPGPGTRIVGARVGGEPTSIARDGDAWLVPLLKSVETVQGLLNFPVDLLILSDGTPFDDKEERTVPLPVVDSEVAVTRVTLSLPVGWDNRLEPGEAGRVEDFTEGTGITYGFAAGDENVAKADALFQDAVGAWMDNDFDRAQQALEDLRSIGADNENIARLQSNIDLVFGGEDQDKGGAGGGGQAVALQRRVKEQAQARAAEDVQVQNALLEEAENAYLSGDYGKAEEAWNQALDIGENLERIQQEESVEQSYSNVQVREKLAKAQDEKKKRSKSATKADEVDTRGFIEIDLSEEDELFEVVDGKRGPQEPVYKERTEIDFEGIDVTGDLVKPQGGLYLEDRNGELSKAFAAAEERRRAEEEARRRAEEEARRQAEAEAARRVTSAEEAERRASEEVARKDAQAYEVERLRAEAEAAAAAVAMDPDPEPEPVASGDYDGDAVLYRRSGGLGNVRIGSAKKSPPPPPPSPPPSAPSAGKMSKDDLQRIPSGRTYQTATESAGVAVGAGQGANPNLAGAITTENTYLPEEPPMPEPEGFAPLDVTASTLDVVIPTFGDTVRYQHLLLPAGQAHAVVVRAKKNKRGNR